MLRNTLFTMLEISLTISVIVALVFLLSPLIKKYYKARLRYTLWFILAMRLLIPFHITLPKTPVQISVPEKVISPLFAIQTVPADSPSAAVGTVVSTPTTASLSVYEYAALIWITGAVIFIIWQLCGYLSLQRKVHRWGNPCVNCITNDLFSQVNKEMGIKKNIKLLICKKISSPMMFGFVNTVVLLPCDNYSEDDLRLIFRHELIHYKHRDLWYKLLLLTANAAHWFNPLVYLMRRTANRDIEIFCDEELVQDTDMDFRKKYSETLLGAIHVQHYGNTSLSTYFYGGKKTMKDRFKCILTIGKKRRGIFIICVISVAAILAGIWLVFHLEDSSKGKIIQTVAAHSIATKLPDNSIIDLPSYTPEQIVNLYYDCLKQGNLKLLNKLFSSNWMSKYGEYTALNPQNIYDIKINHAASADPSIVCYQTSFKIRGGDFFFNTFTSGEEAYEFYPRLIKEDGVWKIDSMPTSPPSLVFKDKICGYDVNVVYFEGESNIELQDKRHLFAIQYILALSRGNWDTIKAMSTKEFFNGVQNINPESYSEDQSRFYSAKSLVGKQIESIVQVHYFTRGQDPYVYVSLGITDKTIECEVHLTIDNKGSILVSGLAY